MKDLENIKLSLNDSNQIILTATVDGHEARFHIPSTALVSFGTFDDVEVVDEPGECPIPNEDENPIEMEELEDTPTKKSEPEYTVWIKDNLWGKGFEVSGDEWTWKRTIDHSYTIYLEGPEGTKVYPQIESYGKLRTSKEDLTSRGPKIGFNRIENIPITLKGQGTKVLVGSDLGPGSATAKGYDGYLVFVNDKSEVVKRIHMQFV